MPHNIGKCSQYWEMLTALENPHNNGHSTGECSQLTRVLPCNASLKHTSQYENAHDSATLASFPGAEKGEGKKERLVSTVCACALISKNSWKTVSLAGISVTLTSVRLPIFSVWKMNTTTTLCVNDDEGAMKTLSFRSQEWSTCWSIPAKYYYKRWRNLSFEVYRCLERSDADHYRQSDIISDFKFFQMFLARSIALQCGLPAGKLKLVMILV